MPLQTSSSHRPPSGLVMNMMSMMEDPSDLSWCRCCAKPDRSRSNETQLLWYAGSGEKTGLGHQDWDRLILCEFFYICNCLTWKWKTILLKHQQHVLPFCNLNFFACQESCCATCETAQQCQPGRTCGASFKWQGQESQISHPSSERSNQRLDWCKTDPSRGKETTLECFV